MKSTLVLVALVLVGIGCAAPRPCPVAPVAAPAPTIDLAAEGRALARRPMLVWSVFAPGVVHYMPPAIP